MTDLPYTIHSETRITLSQEVKDWAAEFGMTLNEMARHLIQQEKLREMGAIQQRGEN
jgi:hypothetical protein